MVSIHCQVLLMSESLWTAIFCLKDWSEAYSCACFILLAHQRSYKELFLAITQLHAEEYQFTIWISTTFCLLLLVSFRFHLRSTRSFTLQVDSTKLPNRAKELPLRRWVGGPDKTKSSTKLLFFGKLQQRGLGIQRGTASSNAKSPNVQRIVPHGEGYWPTWSAKEICHDFGESKWNFGSLETDNLKE